MITLLQLSDTIIASALGFLGIIITALITKAVKDREISIRVAEVADRAAKQAAIETAKIQLQQYDDMQEDLRSARGEIKDLNKRLDVVYRTLSLWRIYADGLRAQIIQAGLVPIVFEDHPDSSRKRA